MRKLQILSIDHKSHSSKERQAMELNSNQYGELSSYIQFVLGAHGHVFLSTCNRIEIYYDAERDLTELIIKKWLDITDNQDEQQNKIITHLGSDRCIAHILQLSIGTKSSILGDDQIHNQLKKAFESARSNGTMSTLIERAYQTLMRFHKQVCRDTEYRNVTVSLAYHSLKSIYRYIPKSETPNKSVLIIGAGDMATQIVKYLPKFNFASIAITNRSEDKAIRLAKDKNIEVIKYGLIDAKDYDIIISCTDQGHELILNIAQLDYYIDLSLGSAHIKNIDCPSIILEKLQSFITTQSIGRLGCLSEVSSIMKNHEEQYLKWLGQWWSHKSRIQINSLSYE